MEDVTEISVRWNNISLKAIIDSIIETTEDGRYSSMKNKKASWNSAVLIFNSNRPELQQENSCLPTSVNEDKLGCIRPLRKLQRLWYR